MSLSVDRFTTGDVQLQSSSSRGQADCAETARRAAQLHVSGLEAT